ncbi:hypothetical protein ELG92_10570 [Rhizobium leguminosarum]|nr:hypothetical protein ELG92_10570 [Rhizobium leguminosarum]
MSGKIQEVELGDEFTYDAFASHASDPDGELVRVVEARIEAFHRQTGIAEAYRHPLEMCVDGRDFIFPKKRGNDAEIIEEVVRVHLRRSRALVVFAGPQSRLHHWVNQEIKWWDEDRPGGPIYFVLTHGDDPKDKDANMPPALVARGGPDNVIFVDLRSFYSEVRPLAWIARSKDSEGKRRLRKEATTWQSIRSSSHEETAKLAALLVSDATGNSISVAELVSAYEQAERKQRRIRLVWRGAIALVLLGLIATAFSAGSAAVSSRKKELQSAWSQQGEALSNSLGPELIDALAFAASAVSQGDEPNAIHALYNVLPKLIPIEKTFKPSAIASPSEQTQTALLFGDDRWLAFGGRDGILHISNASDGIEAATLPLNCGRITAMLEQPDGKGLIVASDRGLRFVTLANIDGKLSSTLAGAALETERIRAITLSPELGLLAGSLYGKIWNLRMGPGLDHSEARLITQIMDPRYEDVPSSVFGMALRGTTLFVAGIDGVLTKYDVSGAPKITSQIVHPSSIFALDVSRSGGAVALADQEGNLNVYDGALSNRRVAAMRPAQPASVAQDALGTWFSSQVDQPSSVGIAFDSTGDIIGIASFDRTVKFLLAKDLRLIGSVVHGAPTRGVVFAREKPLAYTFGDDGIINVVRPVSQQNDIRIGNVAGFAVMPGAAKIAYWVNGENKRSTAYVLNLESPRYGETLGSFPLSSISNGLAFGDNSLLVRTLSVHVNGFSINGSGGCVANGLDHPNEADGSQQVYRLIRGTRPGEIATVASADAAKISYIRLWNSSDCKVNFVQRYSGTPQQAIAVDGAVGVVNHGRQVRIFKPGENTPPTNIDFADNVSALAMSPNAKEVIVQLTGATRCSCTLTTGRPTESDICASTGSIYQCHVIASSPSLPAATNLQMSVTGRFLTMSYGSGLALASREVASVLEPVAPRQVSVVASAFSFSPDESLLALPAGDTGIKVIDPNSRDVKALLPTPSRPQQIDFLQDGSNRIATLDGGVLRVWDLRKDELLKRACERWPVSFAEVESSATSPPRRRAELCGPPL